MTRKPMMAGNWKMNKTIGEAVVLAQEICNEYDSKWDDGCDVVVCPPFVDLKPAKTVFEFDRVPVGVGAQNVHWEESGAYTGEISVPMLKEIGCRMVQGYYYSKPIPFAEFMDKYLLIDKAGKEKPAESETEQKDGAKQKSAD